VLSFAPLRLLTMAHVPAGEVLIPSILDTDLYKLTMQQAVLAQFSTAQVSYKFTNRSKDTTFTRSCLELFESNVSKLSEVALKPEERKWIEQECAFFFEPYLDYLSTFRFKPTEQVTIRFVPDSPSDPDRGQIEIDVHGLWLETILYEVPLMSALSDAYFRTVDTDWTYEGQEELAYQKGLAFLKNGIMLSEFGTRRRRSLNAQRLVIEGLVRARDEFQGKAGISGQLRGTSNVHLAHKYGLTPIGTIAHEWTMGIAALRGYDGPNSPALDIWEQVYPAESPSSPAMYIALTDTFTSDVFFRELLADPERAKRWKGLRQDSGDAIEFARRAKQVYEELGIDWTTKAVVFSDSLNLNKAIEIQRVAGDIGFQTSFGVGTFLTNDFRATSTGEKSKALNIVIKLASIDERPCVKLSDDLGKNTGDAKTVANLKSKFGLPG